MPKKTPATRGIGPDAVSGRPLDVTVLVLDQGFASTAIAPIEIFHSAGYLWNWIHGETTAPRFRVRTASLDGKSVDSHCSLGLKPEYALRDIKQTDLIVVPAAGWDVTEEIAKNSQLVPWLKRWHARGAYIAGVCTGVAFLAEAGLLDGREATTHWAVADVMKARYPQVNWRTEQFVTEDGRLFCSGGIYASMDLSLYLVEKFCGHEIALQCAKSLLLGMPRTHQSGYAMSSLSPPHADRKIQQVERYLQQHHGREISIGLLADQAGMSPRNLIRRFKAATGRLPGAYLQMLRVTEAQSLLEQGAASIQEVCSKVGYEDLAFFRNLFKRHTGMTPAEYRARFARLRFERGDLSSRDSA